MTAPLLRAAFLCLLLVTPAAAQDWPGRFELGASAVWLGGTNIAEVSATETANRPAGAERFVLFQARTRIEPSAAFGAVLGLRLGRALGVEGSFRYARPSLAVTIANDAEGASKPDTLRERMTQYSIDGSLLLYVRRFAIGGGRAVPFAYGGAGGQRLLHDANVLATNSLSWHAGGGLKVLLTSHPRGFMKGLIARGQAGVVNGRDAGGIDDNRRTNVVASVGLSLLF